MKSTMLYIIAYDIPSDKRRNKVHKTLCGFGDWTQYSLFECFLDAKELIQLQAKLDKILNAEEDSVRIYPLCNACQERVETIGSASPKEKIAYIL
jgi:CRISPR-associated protein Cas2